MANTTIVSDGWEIGMFEVGDTSLCCYAFWCSKCAIAEARTNLDGSSCLFNFCCMNRTVTTYLIKSAYGMNQDFSILEFLYSYFCGGCYANQIYQTALRRGNPTVDGGQMFNKRIIPQNDGCIPPCNDNGFNACFCGRCMNASSLNKHVGMPYWMGCCCSHPVQGQNILRYQHRIAGDDKAPLFWSLIAHIFPMFYCFWWVVEASEQAHFTAEVDKLGVISDRYLAYNMISDQLLPSAELTENQNPIQKYH